MRDAYEKWSQKIVGLIAISGYRCGFDAQVCRCSGDNRQLFDEKIKSFTIKIQTSYYGMTWIRSEGQGCETIEKYILF